MRRRHFISGLAGTAAGLGLTTATGPAATAHSTDTAFLPGWQPVSVPEGRTAAQLLGVAAGGPDAAWAVGEEGRNGATRGKPLAMTWDGTAWSRTALDHLGLSGQLHSVAAASPHAAWAVGTDTSGTGHLLAWDGGTWQQVPYPGKGDTGTVITSVTAAPDGRAWVSGRNSDNLSLLHWNGQRWRWCAPLPSTVTEVPSGVHRTPGDEIWVYGVGIAARWDGTWTELAPPTGLRFGVTGLLPRTHDDVWLTGYDYGVGGPPGKPPGCVLRHWDGTSWNNVTPPFTVGRLSGITGDEQGHPDRIAGWDFWDQTRAHYLRWDGTAWVSERGPLATTPVLLNSLARVPGTGEYWSVGTNSSAPYPPAQAHMEHFGP
ncbi:hypothetical protein ACH4UV_32200 [Streptomyces sp. NPDC020802]|uniref:hypothetical protein n=1 Tax=Streptomyces sp. NPDC020802 TaxID=3365094 RepID=UPI0037B94F59